MDDFIKKLKEKVLAGMRKIDRQDVGRMERSLAYSRLLSDAFNHLRTYIITYEFNNGRGNIFF